MNIKSLTLMAFIAVASFMFVVPTIRDQRLEERFEGQPFPELQPESTHHTAQHQPSPVRVNELALEIMPVTAPSGDQSLPLAAATSIAAPSEIRTESSNLTPPLEDAHSSSPNGAVSPQDLPQQHVGEPSPESFQHDSFGLGKPLNPPALASPFAMPVSQGDDRLAPQHVDEAEHNPATTAGFGSISESHSGAPALAGSALAGSALAGSALAGSVAPFSSEGAETTIHETRTQLPTIYTGSAKSQPGTQPAYVAWNRYASSNNAEHASPNTLKRPTARPRFDETPIRVAVESFGTPESANIVNEEVETEPLGFPQQPTVVESSESSPTPTLAETDRDDAKVVTAPTFQGNSESTDTTTQAEPTLASERDEQQTLAPSVLSFAPPAEARPANKQQNESATTTVAAPAPAFVNHVEIDPPTTTQPTKLTERLAVGFDNHEATAQPSHPWAGSPPTTISTPAPHECDSQSDCDTAPPIGCDDMPGSCGDDGLGLSVGGWFSAGYHSASNDLFNSRPDQFALHQGWVYLERVATEDNPVGFRVDAMYGIDADDTQAFGNNAGEFDFLNGLDYGSYGWAFPQLYLDLALGEWNVRAGHFFTLLGYEVVGAPDNFFYSHAITMYNSEPFTHTGVLLNRQFGNFDVYAGWTLGWDTGFDQFDDGSSWLGGFIYELGDFASLAYFSTAGDFGRRGDKGYSQSVVLDLEITDEFNYVIQSDYLRVKGTGEDNVGVNQYVLYTLSDKLAIGARMEWWKGDVLTGYAPHGGVLPAAGSLSYYAATLGLNIYPADALVIRPELRHDWSPAANYEETYFGIDAIWTF